MSPFLTVLAVVKAAILLLVFWLTGQVPEDLELTTFPEQNRSSGFLRLLTEIGLLTRLQRRHRTDFPVSLLPAPKAADNAAEP